MIRRREEKKNEKTDKKSKAWIAKKNGVKPKNEAENACLQGVDDDEASCGFAGNIDRAIKFCESTKNADPCCHKLSDPSSTVNAMTSSSPPSPTSTPTCPPNPSSNPSTPTLRPSLTNPITLSLPTKNPPIPPFGYHGVERLFKKSITALGLPQDLKEDATKTKPVVNPIDSMPKLDDGDEEEEAITDVKVNQVPIDAPPSKTKAKKSPPSKTKAASKSKKSGTGASKKKNATSRAGLKNPKQTNAPGSDGKSSFWSAGAIAGVAVGCVLVVGGIIAGVVVVQRRGSRIKKPFTIKKFNHNPLLGGNGGNGAATGASTALLGGGGGAGPVGVVSGDLRPRRVIYDYEPVQPDEILLTPGDLVEVSVEYDDGWATGKNLSTGRIGTFPVTCLAK
ncbi:hypothetical protein BC829DRAFT_494512 [Chytridium lagenaria]|nr:hypothetical protein BC829DRAFT_494512 [Chytridium lagenaria]